MMQNLSGHLTAVFMDLMYSAIHCSGAKNVNLFGRRLTFFFLRAAAYWLASIAAPTKAEAPLDSAH